MTQVNRIFISFFMLWSLVLSSAYGLTQATGNYQHELEREKRIAFWQKKLDSDFPLVRKSATVQLSSLRATSALPALIEHLSDSSTEVRSAVVKALGILGNKSTIAILKAHLKRDPDRVVRKQASRAIRKIKERIKKKDASKSSESQR